MFYPNVIISNLNSSNIGQKRNNKTWFKKFRWKYYNINNFNLSYDNNCKKILVVMPTFNRSQNIEKSIQMFLKQSYNNFTLLIINDGSNENHYSQIIKIEEKYKTNTQILFKHNSTNIKIAKTLNKGICFMENQYDYFTWVSDDNHYYPNFLECLLNLKGDFSYSNFLFLNRITGIKSYNNNKYRNVIDLINNFGGCASFMWSKSAINTGLYSEDLEGCEDYDT